MPSLNYFPRGLCMWHSDSLPFCSLRGTISFILSSDSGHQNLICCLWFWALGRPWNVQITLIFIWGIRNLFFSSKSFYQSIIYIQESTILKDIAQQIFTNWLITCLDNFYGYSQPEDPCLPSSEPSPPSPRNALPWFLQVWTCLTRFWTLYMWTHIADLFLCLASFFNNTCVRFIHAVVCSSKLFIPIVG